MTTVYLINLSFGLAGIERRFANIWRVLRRRGRVRPVLVVPDTLADLLARADLVDRGDDLVWCVPEAAWARAAGRIALPGRAESFKAFGRAWLMARAYDRLWGEIARDPAAVVHVGLNCSSLTPPDVPLVYECVDSTLTQLGTRHYVKASARPCIVHCQTDRIREALERTMAPRSPSWTTVVSPCYFSNYSEEPALPRPPAPVVAAFVGRFSPEKNPHLFVEAIARARATGLDVRGLMLGEGPLAPELRRQIERLGLDAAVDFRFSQSPASCLREAAIFVTLQTGDNYGSQSLLEAMGAGCAVIASDVGETRRLVTPDVGVLVAQDAGDIARALVELASRPDRLGAMGAQAARVVRHTHSADAYVSFLESLYESAAMKHAAARLSPAGGRPTGPVADPVSKHP